MANSTSKAAGANLMAGADFEVSWVIRGTEWSQGTVPTGWQAISNQVASGSGLSGHAAQDLVAIQKEIQTQANQTYVLRLQVQQAVAAGSVLEVAWGDDTVATLRGEDLKPPQSMQLLLPGVDGSRSLRLITSKRSDFGRVSGLGLFSEPVQKPGAVELPGAAAEGQTLKANTTQLKDTDGLGTLKYQWQRKGADGLGWRDITGANQAELQLGQSLVGSELRLSVSYVDGGGTTEVVVSKPTVAVSSANRAPDAGGVKQLAEINEDQSVVLTRTDLLRGASDANRDALGVVNVQLEQGSGTITPIDADNWRFTPAANWSGDVKLRYEITDGKARTPAAAQFSVLAVNDAPILTGIPATLASGSEDTVYTIRASDLLAGHSDVEGDKLSVSGLSVTFSGVTVAAAQGGSLVNNGNGTWTLTPPKDFNGTVNLSYAVIDGLGGSSAATQSFSLAAVNDAPVLSGTETTLAGGSEDLVYTIKASDLLAGYSDVDGDALSVSGLSASVGSLHNNGDGTWALTPPKDFNGTVNLSYSVTDGQGASIAATQTFSLAAVNDAPVLSGLKAALSDGTEDLVYTIKASDLLVGYSDVDGDALSVSGLSASVGSLQNNGDGTWSLTPPKDFNGTVNLSYAVIDGQGASIAATQTFSLAAVNDTPTVSGPTNVGVMSEDGTLRITKDQLLANAHDVEGDALGISGLKVKSGSGQISDNGDGSWTFKPSANWHGPAELEYNVHELQTVNKQITFNRFPTTISYAVWNGSQLNNETREIRTLPFTLTFAVREGSGFRNETQSFNRFPSTLNYLSVEAGNEAVGTTAQLVVTPVNDAPILSGQTASLAGGTEDLVYTIKASDLLAGYSDVDGDALSVSGLFASVGTVHNNGDGTWALTPPKDFNGTVNLSYSVTDGQGASIAATQTFSLDPINDAPVTKTMRIDVETDDPTTVRLTREQLLVGSSDPDGDALRIENLKLLSGKASIRQNPDGSWNLTTERHSNGDSVLRFDVSDGALSSQAQIIVNVIRKPVLSTFTVLDSAISGNEGEKTLIRVQRDGDRTTEQTVHFRLEGGELNSQDLGIGTAFFASGSDQATVEVVFAKDGRWEGLETGRLVAERVEGPNNVQCNWTNTSTEVCLRDLDSRHDGTGNNSSGNGYGSAGVLEQRLADADYGDGHDSPSGLNRPGARTISNKVVQQTEIKRSAQELSDFVWGWGQFIDHDLVATTSGNELFSIALPSDDKLVLEDHPACEDTGAVIIPGGIWSPPTVIQTTPIHETPNNHLVFTRSSGFHDSQGVRQQRNDATAFLDGSVVYGSNETTANQLRSGQGGKLKIDDQGLLPTHQTREGLGFMAGDHRATENPLLSSLQTLWVREHNRITDELAKANPKLSDEQLYQQARVKVMGLLQHITYDEFLPALLGESSISSYKGYDANTNPGIFNEFAAAAYRFGHSMISENLASRNHDGSVAAEGDIPLKDAFFNIQFLQKSGIDTVLRGASLQQAQEIDSEYTDSLRNFLFSKPPEGSKCPMRGILRFTNGAFPALDLASRNIQRGRDHGLDDYNSVREAMGLKRVNSFDEITSNKELAQKLKDLYGGNIDNVDLYIAGLAEDHAEGSSMGELFGSIIVRQFEAIRDGDRFWYENSDNGLFTAAEIAEIKATKLSDVIERNTDITGLRDNVFLVSIKGTAGNDVLHGTHLADKFCASLGQDRIYGGEGTDTVDYTTINGTVTLRFDGVLKGSNSLDQEGMDAWAGLQDLANQGNGTAAEIFKLHQGFFGHSISGFFNDQDAAQAPLPAGGPAESRVPAGLGFDQLNSIEVIKAHQGSSIDGRGATVTVQADLAAGTFSTSFFQHPIRTLVEGFTHVFGSRHNDEIKGDAQNNTLLGMGGDDLLEGRDGEDQLVGGSGDDRIEGGQGSDTAHFSGHLSDYTIWAEDKVLHVEDKRPGAVRDGSDQLRDVEWLQFADQKVATRPYLNKAPVLSSPQAVLAEGSEDTAYTFTTADLLKGFADPDGDPLFISDLKANQGELKATGDGIWTLIPPKDFNGTIELSYSVADDLGAKTAAKQSLKLAAVNDAPVVNGEVNLGSMNEDGSFRIWSDKLLATASDVDGDALKVVDLKLTSGQGVITDNGDGSWNFAPSRDWSGPVSFSYGVTDGKATISNEQRKDLIIRGSSLYIEVEGANWLWSESEREAVKLGGHLATITSQEENDFLNKEFFFTNPNERIKADLHVASPSETIAGHWIGFTDSDTEGNWKWISGEPGTFINWGGGQPDNNYAGSGGQDYAILMHQDQPGKWDDLTDSDRAYRGIAEIPFIRRGDSAYVIVQGKTWEEAEANSVKLGGHLVTINSEDENRFLTQIGAGGSENYYIGLTDKGHEGHWTWASGESSTYRNWAREGVDWQVTAPNGGSAENYGVIMGSNKIFQNGSWIPNPNPTWHDWNNSAHLGIAEIKLGSDFSIAAGSARLTVNPDNDATSGDLGIDVIGSPNDVVSHDPGALGWGDVQGAGSALGLGGANPARADFTGDLLTGSTGSDSIMGTNANDTLIGSLRGASTEQVDVLTGGSGSDLFVLGDSQSSFYSAQGFKDFARITDFDPTKDQLQVFGGDLYLAAGINRPDVVGTGVFKDADRNGVIGNGDDLIAVVSNQNNPVELGRDNVRTV